MTGHDPAAARPPSDRRRFGILTPSSNTHAEPTTVAMLATVPGATAHFTRFPLPTSLHEAGDREAMRDGARMLADAQVDAVVFHGTVGSWLGIDHDLDLADDLSAAAGVPATTATLATIAAIKAMDASTFSLAFPGPADIAEQIASTYADQGLTCTHVQTAGLDDNHAVAAMSTEDVREFVASAAHPDADVVAVIGTNFPSTAHVADLEADLDVTIVDSTAAVTWQLLAMTGIATPVRGWGRLLANAGHGA